MSLQKFKTGQYKALVDETESIHETESVILLGNGVNSCLTRVSFPFPTSVILKKSLTQSRDYTKNAIQQRETHGLSTHPPVAFRTTRGVGLNS